MAGEQETTPISPTACWRARISGHIQMLYCQVDAAALPAIIAGIKRRTDAP